MKRIVLILISLLFLYSCNSIKQTSESLSESKDYSTERIEFWNQWLDVCAPGNEATSTSPDWAKTTFRTVGVAYDSFIIEDSLEYMAMLALYSTEESAKKYLPGVIESGSDYPDKAVIKKGEYLTKIVKIGADISGPSVYYITPVELNHLKMNPDRIEQELGLPLTSNTGTYLIFRIYALDDNVVFQSHIAPTLQYSSIGQAVYWTCGGAIQTLVIDNNDTARWAKDSIPSDTLKIHTLPDINQRLDYK